MIVRVALRLTRPTVTGPPTQPCFTARRPTLTAGRYRQRSRCSCDSDAQRAPNGAMVLPMALTERITRRMEHPRLLRGTHFHTHRAAARNLIARRSLPQPDAPRPHHCELIEFRVARGLENIGTHDRMIGSETYGHDHPLAAAEMLAGDRNDDRRIIERRQRLRRRGRRVALTCLVMGTCALLRAGGQRGPARRVLLSR